jgi:hypothetical protein
MIYIDTSPVLKLVQPGAESGALRTWLASPAGATGHTPAIHGAATKTKT